MPMLSGKRKVRRFGQIYPSRRSTAAIVLRTTLTITLLLLFGFVGWNAYGPVSDYFSGKLAAMSRQQTKTEASVPEQATTPTPPAVVAEPEKPAHLKSIYLPTELLADETRLKAALEKLKDTPINAVLFDLKDVSGKVHYESALPQVAELQVQSEITMDLDAVCGVLEEYGITPIGRMSVYADPLAAYRLSGAGIKYMNTEMLWLDNSPENGGKGWLNPYSAEAADYLAALVKEATSKGVQRILLDQHSFPNGVGQEFANFGGEADLSAQGKAAALKAGLAALEKAAQEQDAAISLYVSGQGALGQTNALYGDVNPLTLYEDVTVGVMPAQFGDRYVQEAFTLEQPLQKPYETVKALLTHLKDGLSGKQVTAMVQGYTATGALESNKVYTEQDISDQLRALQEASIEDYIIYSAGGNYPAGTESAAQ